MVRVVIAYLSLKVFSFNSYKMYHKVLKRARSLSPTGKNQIKDVPRPYISAQCGQFICEHVIAQDGILDLFGAEHIWKELKLEVMNRFRLEAETEVLKKIWIEYIDRSYEQILEVRWSGPALPVIAYDDPIQVKYLKGNIRFMAYRKVYFEATAPLSIQIHESFNSSSSSSSPSSSLSLSPAISPPPPSSSSSVSSICDTPQYSTKIADIVPPPMTLANLWNRHCEEGNSISSLTSNEKSGDVKLFTNKSFYLMRVDNILKQSERWRIEFLLRIHGGSCVTMESQITENTLILAIDDTPIKLVKLKMWYKAKVYRPELIMRSIAEGRFDSKLLKKYEWHTPYIPNFTQEAGLMDMVSDSDSSEEDEEEDEAEEEESD